MTWRWKNIHFAKDDPPAGNDEAGKKAAKEHADYLKWQEDRKKNSAALASADRAALKHAQNMGASIRELAELENTMATDRFSAVKQEIAQMKELAEDLGGLNAIDELRLATLQRQLKNSEDQLKVANSLKDQTSGIASFFTGIEDKSGSFTHNLISAMTSTETITGNSSAMNLSIIKSAEGMLDLTSAANVFGSLLDSFVEGFMMTFAELESALPKFAAATGAARTLHGELVSVTKELRQFGVGMEEGAAAMGALLSTHANFNRMSRGTRAEMITLAATLETVGVSSETTANLLNSLNKSLGMSTEASMTTIKAVAATARALEMPVGEMVAAFDAAMPRLAQFGTAAPEVFKKVAAAAKATGIEMGALLGIVGQFDTWEGAADAAGRLNALFGGPLLNSIDLLKASDEERIRMLIGSMEASGKSWQSMSRFEKQAIASAAGISDMNEAGKLFSTTLSEYDWQLKEAAQAEKSQEAYNEMIKAATPILEKFKELQMKMWTVFNDMGLPTLLGYISDALSALASQPAWVILGEFLAATLISIKILRIGASMALKRLAGDVKKFAEHVGEGFGEGFKKVTKSVADAAEDAADSVGGAAGKVMEKTGEAAGKVVEGLGESAGKAAETASEGAAAGIDTVTESLEGVGPQARAGATSMLKLGAAFFLIGAGIAIAALGLAELVKAFGDIGDNAWPAAAAVIGFTVAFSILMFALASMVTGPQAVVAAGAVLLLWSVAAAAVGMGIGIGLAAFGMSKLIAAMANMKPEAMIAMGQAFVMMGAAFAIIAMTAPTASMGLWMLAGAFMIMAVGVWLVVPPITKLMESMSALSAQQSGLAAIGKAFLDIADAVNQIPSTKAVLVTSMIAATGAAAAIGGILGGGAAGESALQAEVQRLAAAVGELSSEVATGNVLYRQIAKQPIVIKLDGKVIKKIAGQELNAKWIAAARANTSPLTS